MSCSDSSTAWTPDPATVLRLYTELDKGEYWMPSSDPDLDIILVKVLGGWSSTGSVLAEELPVLRRKK